MKEQTRRIQARTHKLVLTKDNISKIFVKLGNKRQIRRATVSKLYRALMNGKHFETPLMTNFKDGKERLLDGNHRVEAIEQFLEEKPNMKVEVWVFSYDNLGDQEEKEIYTTWNLGMKQTTNDFIQQYWKEIPLTRIFKSNGFPFDVTPLWTSKSMEFRTLVAAYLCTIPTVYPGSFSGSAIEFIEASKKLKEDDYKIMKAFLKEYISIYGNPDKRNLHYRPSTFNGLFRIWRDNLQTKNPVEMHNMFLKLRGHERVVYYSSFQNRNVNMQARIDFLNVINSNRTKNLFV